MAKGNSIAAAVLAAAGNPGAGGSGPSVAGGLSPLVASYSQQYSADVPYSPLPRPASVFLNGAFGPMQPIMAMPIDPPREDTHRPDPRRFQYPVGFNLATEPGTEGFRLAPYSVLRNLSRTYSVARSCVDKRKAEIVGLEWDIVPTDEAERSMVDDDKARADFEKRRAVVKEFFSHPDSDRAKYPTFKAWLSALLEDRFVIDAVAVHLVPPRKKGSGPFGSDIASLDLLDGALIRPNLSIRGSTPKPPSPAYSQFVWGVPRVDLTSVINEADAAELSEPVADYRADQMIYMMETPRDDSPYGMSCVEKALLPIQIGLARQSFQADFFTDGSVPAMFVYPGPDISTPQQIRQLQDALNAMSTDPSAKRRIIVLPADSKADPQKPVALADQFDEWIISQVSMPFGLTPMDLGVTPRVSAVQSPSESRELSQINSDKGSQTRVEPVCADLKDIIFDFVIQQLFKQKDMEFSWGLKDRGKNRQALIDQGVELVKVGGKTVDELRIDLGDAPYGLPETSTPLVYTATGAVPLAAVAAEEQPPVLAGAPQRPALPPGQAQQQGNQPPQVSDDDLTTPAHEAAQDLKDTPGNGGSKDAKADSGNDDKDDAAKKAVAAELEVLARYLKKGRDLSRFEPRSLPPESVAAAARALPSGVPAAVKAAATAAEAKARQEKRDKKLEATAAVVAAGLGAIVRSHKTDKLSLPHVIDQGVQVLADGYSKAIAEGSSDASGDYEDTPVIPDNGTAQQAAEGQRGFLTGFLQDIAGGLSSGLIGSRLGLYASTLWKAYNQSYGNTVMTAHPDYVIIWELGDNSDHCQPCLDRDGKEFTLDTLPGWPGDGGFGGTGILGQQNICAGGPRCRCSVRMVQGGQTVATGTNTQLPWAGDYYAQQNARITAARQQAAQARSDFLDSIPAPAAARAMTRDAFRHQVADAVNARIRAAGGYSGVSVEPQDVPAGLIAQMLPAGMEGAAGPNETPMSVREAADRMFASKSAVIDMTRAELAAVLGKALEDVAAPDGCPPASAEAVYQQLLENYRPEGIGWVRDCPWAGPCEVPLDDVDWDHLGSWAAAHDEAHVDRFEGRYRDGGEDVNPVVAVTVPGSPLAKVIDGHHRALARKRLGEPVTAYLGQLGTDSPTAAAWRTHLYQIHSGGDPLNKALGDEDPSRVAFLLIRAKNENGKLRYLLHLRTDGSWGLPGGHCHDGEVPWDAAVREAREELGTLPQVTPSAVWARPEGDHVTWTYLVDLPGTFAPSGDGGGETAGHGWFRRKDVEGLDLHPAMRRTWEELDFGEPDLGGRPVDFPKGGRPELAVLAGAAAARKEARGYELSPLSGMISLDVPDGLVEPVPGGVTDGHLTIVYLGKGLTDEVLAQACARAAAAAALVPGPLNGVISGRGTFEPSESSDGKVVVWAGITLPGAETLRAALEDLSASSFTQWSPHVTRAYVDEGDPLPDPVPPTPVTFTHLSVHRSDGKLFRFALGGTDQPGEPHQGDRSTCPCGTPVEYDEMNGWQHADGSISHDDGESVSDKMRGR